jgi:hypothetical protein
MDAHEVDRELYQTWVLLLNGWGFNWYRQDNQLQADDLLVRNRVCGDLDAAGVRLREIEAAFRKRHLPPPSRAAPLPDAEKLREAQAIAALRERVAALETRIRGLAMPPDDRICAAHRDHVSTLATLLDADTKLVGAAHDLAEALARADAEATADRLLAGCGPSLAWLERALAERKAALDIAIAG